MEVFRFGDVPAIMVLVICKVINDILTKEKYHSILQRHAIQSGLKLCGHGFVLQQDNDPKHTSKVCRKYLQKKKSPWCAGCYGFSSSVP